MELTKYELARIIGARALQLSAGAPPLIKKIEDSSFMGIAEKEVREKVIPLIVPMKKGL